MMRFLGMRSINKLAIAIEVKSYANTSRRLIESLGLSHREFAKSRTTNVKC